MVECVVSIVKRFVDKPRYIWDTGIAWKERNETCVVCPSCEKMGIVRYDDGKFIFRCPHCAKRKEQSAFIKVETSCSVCRAFFRVEIPTEKHQLKGFKVKCPYCSTLNSGKSQKIDKLIFGRARHENTAAKDLIFGYPLYFLDYLDGKPIWALNREHLQYLIDYVEADLRETPINGRTFYSVKGASYQLPTFMKLAKNRDKMLKILRRMQAK